MNCNELVRYSNGLNPFNECEVIFTKNEIDENLRPVLIEKIIPYVKKNSNDYLFFTLWLITDKITVHSIGSMSFKGPPDSDGKVEIGYGTHEEFRNRGYMTEAVGALCSWVFKSNNVKKVIAETAKDNPSSFRVLMKNNFMKYKENDKFFYWIRSK